VSITVVLVDDHPVVRRGIRTLLEAEPDFSVVGETGDGLEVQGLVRRLRPNVLIIDLALPGLAGLEVTRRVSKRFPETRVVILSMHDDESYVLQALRNGALGYVLKGADPEEVVLAVRQAAAGHRSLSRSLSARPLAASTGNLAATATRYDTLTDREREVLHLVMEGLRNADVGRRLAISPRTVEVHRAAVMRKLGVKNLAALVRYAIRSGLLPT
jgi:DNA-binding NarL/FixJ family response regulator